MRYSLLVLLLSSTAFGDIVVSKGSLPQSITAPISSGKGVVVGRGELPTLNGAGLRQSRPKLTMYTANWCGWCRVAKSKLTPDVLASLPFDVILVDVDRSNEYGGSLPAFRWYTPTGSRTVGWSSWEGIKADWRKTTIPTPIPQAIIRKGVNGRLTPEELKSFSASYQGPPYGVSDGNFWGHLQSSNHGFTSNQLVGLTQAECAKIHAGHHWGYLTPFKIGK